MNEPYIMLIEIEGKGLGETVDNVLNEIYTQRVLQDVSRECQLTKSNLKEAISILSSAMDKYASCRIDRAQYKYDLEKTTALLLRELCELNNENIEEIIS